MMKAELYINGALVYPKEIPEEQREYISYQVVKQFLALTQARSKDIPRIKALNKLLRQEFPEVFEIEGL